MSGDVQKWHEGRLKAREEKECGDIRRLSELQKKTIQMFCDARGEMINYDALPAEQKVAIHKRLVKDWGSRALLESRLGQDREGDQYTLAHRAWEGALDEAILDLPQHKTITQLLRGENTDPDDRKGLLLRVTGVHIENEFLEVYKRTLKRDLVTAERVDDTEEVRAAQERIVKLGHKFIADCSDLATRLSAQKEEKIAGMREQLHTVRSHSALGDGGGIYTKLMVGTFLGAATLAGGAIGIARYAGSNSEKPAADQPKPVHIDRLENERMPVAPER